MSSPTVQTTNTGTSAKSTSVVVNLPSGIQSGDLLVIVVSIDGTSGGWTTTGWTQLDVDDSNAGAVLLSIFYKTATGSEGASVTFTTGTSRDFTCVSYRISGWQGTPEHGTFATGTSTTADPPAITPSWGSDADLFLAIIGVASGTVPSAAPANYSNLITSSSVGHTAIGVAQRQLTAASEDPGTFTNVSAAWVAQTVAIRGITAAVTMRLRTLMGVGQ